MTGTRIRPAARAAALLVGAGILLGGSGCATATAPESDADLQVIATTGILRDIAEHVGGDRVSVTSLVPDSADPHTYEPSLRDVRNVVTADVAFSNYMLLEEHSIIKTLDANLREGVPNISLAEGAVKYAAEIIPLVENVSLDTVWLGLRAAGDGAQYGATRSSDVLVSATAVSGPGDVFGYLTGTFGDPEVYFDSSDGFDQATGYRDDTARLPVDAHTHMSWVFTEPGRYELTLEARLQADQNAKPVELATETFTFAVGINPGDVAAPGATILDLGHADFTANLDTDELYVQYDAEGGGEGTQTVYAADAVVIEVPSKAIAEIPAAPQFDFLGTAGAQIYQLPQAVLGKHVHGEIDPHLWQNVRNVMAYAELMRDTLTEQDPDGATVYRDNTDAYLAELDKLDRYLLATINEIPAADRQLVTTHDAFAYLADAYGLDIAGFVTPNPATEPSLADRRKLTETIRNLGVPAVFLEPNLVARASTLTEVAGEQGIEVCTIYGDTFDATVTSYVEMMQFNADSLLRCLG
ncbi:anchored repeat ABC transporter, substrate-binding protein [Cryobacterium frigoriphilum]|uniref:Anchored repeat ABC transporter, substrate-binding protein n=1 Tax=Cryobacterium frigoriphilum TaxID=1259150 RepID=A0A4V3IS33_9MICO|nr:anchored repeat ABC transporter, substrate-binding protein [Cryobacterium frigoriphilum]TFD54739.1 anchored repeat ABC transporter, substrate-binding protein [Cryobacterium frigoriphilum]